MTLVHRILGAAFAFAFSGLVLAQPAPIVIKFSHVNPPNSPKNQAGEYFKKLAEEGTKGRVKIELYPNSTLYKDKEELEALQIGAVQMLAPTLGKFSSMGLKDFEAFDLPYLFDSFDQVHLVTQGPIGKQLFAQLEPKGIKGLAYWDNGFKEMNANRPLVNVADFKGLKMRIFSSKVLAAEMRSLGAAPQVLAASEIYGAMQTGLVDGGENTVSTFYQFKMYEVQSNLTLSDHGYVGYAVVTNKKFWDGLPPDIRAVLDDAIAKATVFGNRIAKKENDDALEALRALNRIKITTLTKAQKDEWKKVLIKSHLDVADRISPELLQAIYKETGIVAPKP
jgi:C4-dicarboxylate-binding protein DctP